MSSAHIVTKDFIIGPADRVTSQINTRPMCGLPDAPPARVISEGEFIRRIRVATGKELAPNDKPIDVCEACAEMMIGIMLDGDEIDPDS